MQTESVLSILVGGIAFETPATGPVLPPAEANTVFTLFDDRAEAFKPPPADPQTYLLVFKQSVRGLTVGAPVEIAGHSRSARSRTFSAQFDAKTMRVLRAGDHPRGPAEIRGQVARRAAGAD